MISDLGSNIVENYLDGLHVIETFPPSYNCSPTNYPYTPFQQLLSILPSRSAKLLPSIYSELIFGELKESFPDDFEIDLNGRTLPWEAACLIPFCDEEVFLDAEKRLLEKESYHEDDKERNIIHFTYYSYKYNKNKDKI